MKKLRFSDAKVGDKVYSRICGAGDILDVESSEGTFPIVCVFADDTDVFTWGGKQHLDDVEPTLFYREGKDNYLTERPKQKVPWDKVPVDTKVLVGDYTKSNYQKHFSSYANKGIDKFVCFSGGKTSWTNDGGRKTSWRYCKLGESIEIEGVTYEAGSD